MDTKMLTVVIPVHNGENYIERAIKSANKNKKYEIEIIVINDASIDGTQCKLNEISKNIPIKIFNLSQNMGVGYCRNLGIEKSNGKYIAFLDSDDFVSNDMYDKTLSLLHERLTQGTISLEEFNKQCEKLGKKRRQS